MMARITEVDQVLQQHPALLTAAVQAAVRDVPDLLQWNKMSAMCGCYDALHEDRLYSVNLITGIALSDGCPPGRLPESVRQHKLYQRCFGGEDMEAVQLGQGVLRSVWRVNDCRYEFRVLPKPSATQGRLVVREYAADGCVLELLDPGLCQAWCHTLPDRLRIMHSHWLCRKTGAVVLCGISFRSTATDFVLLNGPALLGCMRVPLHLRALPWHEIVQKLETEVVTEHLIAHQSSVLTVLGKFENPTCMHVYSLQQLDCGGVTRSQSSMMFNLLRHSLQFELCDGRLMSANMSGYALAEGQQLVQPCTLAEYLVLEPVQPGNGAIKVIVPEGPVQRANASATIGRSDNCRKKLRHRAFEQHQRHGLLTADGVESRLHLAALHSAMGSALPEETSGMTGEERAMQLVRQSWVNRPLSQPELRNMRSIASLANLSPGLELLCHILERSAGQLAFLHDSSANPPAPCSALDGDCATAYHDSCKRTAFNLRQRLTGEEEPQVLGLRGDPLTEQLHAALSGTISLTACTVDAAFVSQTYQDLAASVCWEKAASHLPPMPLELSPKPTTVEADHFKQLQDSWDGHHRLPVESEVQVTAEHLASVHGEVHDKRSEVEACVMRALQTHAPGSRLHLRLASACNSRAALHDAIGMAWQPGLVRMFNPCLTEESAKLVHDAVLLWLQLCVLEDHAQRLVACAAAGDERQQELLRELQVTRTWDVHAHPQWLAFEVEGRLQIRPRQYSVAQYIITHAGSAGEDVLVPGAIVQLSMGEGKTRVILPMLALHWTDTARVLRIKLLSARYPMRRSLQPQDLRAAL